MALPFTYIDVGAYRVTFAGDRALAVKRKMPATGQRKEHWRTVYQTRRATLTHEAGRNPEFDKAVAAAREKL